jgi:hypothetical protein
MPIRQAGKKKRGQVQYCSARGLLEEDFRAKHGYELVVLLVSRGKGRVEICRVVEQRAA